MKKILLIFSALLCLLVPAVFPQESASGGHYVIVTGKPLIPAEKDAADILLQYLKQMLPHASFQIAAEDAMPASAHKKIFVGNTKAVREAGFDVEKMYREELLIAEIGGDLYLSGGHPRGTLYAVFEFLERKGVLFVAPDTKVVPVLKTLAWDQPVLRRIPAFKYRMTVACISAGEFKLFNKYNYYRIAGLTNGDYERYGYPGDCHTFIHYSKKFPLDDPAVFAMDKHGKRLCPKEPGLQAPLCLSYPKTLELLWEQMRAGYARSTQWTKDKNLPIPETYEISMEDDHTMICHCPSCQKIMQEEGCFSGLMLRLVNQLAERMKKLDAKIKISMLVYQKTLLFPKITRPAENVVPRICVHDREWIVNVLAERTDPVTHRNNAEFRKVMEQWIEASRTFGVWEYWTFYTKRRFPHVALDAWDENLKYYQAKGAENILLEMERFQDSFFALKMYLGLKWMDDPQIPREKLIGDFMSAYYGEAAPVMTEYLYELDSAVKAESLREPMGPRHPTSYSYLTPDFFLQSYAKLAKAEKLTENNPLHLKHVRYEYMSLDYGLLNFWGEYASKMPFSKKELLERIRRIETEAINNMCFANEKAQKISRVNDFLDGEAIEAEIPAEVKGTYIYDFKYNSFYIHQGVTRLVNDPDALGGKAMEIIEDREAFHVLPFTAGIYNATVDPEAVGATLVLNAENIPQDEKFHLYKVGHRYLVSGSRIWAHWTWRFQLYPRIAYTATTDFPYDVYISIKFTGPAYVKDSKKPNGVFIDRIITAR